MGTTVILDASDNTLQEEADIPMDSIREESTDSNNDETVDDEEHTLGPDDYDDCAEGHCTLYNVNPSHTTL
jgi:hypothetical protein